MWGPQTIFLRAADGAGAASLANLRPYLHSSARNTHLCEILVSHYFPNGKYSIKCNYWNVAQKISDALRARTKNALNREPLGLSCSKFQDILLARVSIRDVSFKTIGWNGFEKIEFFDDFSWNDPFWCPMRSGLPTFQIKILWFSASPYPKAWETARSGIKIEKKVFLNRSTEPYMRTDFT